MVSHRMAAARYRYSFIIFSFIALNIIIYMLACTSVILVAFFAVAFFAVAFFAVAFFVVAFFVVAFFAVTHSNLRLELLLHLPSLAPTRSNLRLELPLHLPSLAPTCNERDLFSPTIPAHHPKHPPDRTLPLPSVRIIHCTSTTLLQPQRICLKRRKLQSYDWSFL